MVVWEVTAMRSGTMYTLNSDEDELSLTDQILKFCASGRFGVREAVAAATTSRNTPKQQSTTGQGQTDQINTTVPAHLASSTVPLVDGQAIRQP